MENPSLTSAILDPEPPKKEETPISDFMLEFKDELFAQYGNTSNYHTMMKPQKPRITMLMMVGISRSRIFVKQLKLSQI